MKDKYKLILVLMLLMNVVDVLQSVRIDNLENKIAQQEQVIVELQQEVDIIDKYIETIAE